MTALPAIIAIGIAGITAQTETTHFRPIPPPITVVRATGVGYPPRLMRGPQARLMARRAAEVVAVRNLAARLGLPAGTQMVPFSYVSYRELPSGAIEVTVEASVPAVRAPARPLRGP